MDSTDTENKSLDLILQTFQGYQVELDGKHDKYEKLVKKSRDITIESKRIIFLLHRITKTDNKDKILNEASNRLSELYFTITQGIGSMLINEDVYHYNRAFSPGLQEFVEALSFYYYLKHGTLISLEEVYDATFLSDKTKQSHKNKGEEESEEKSLPMSMILSPLDYILGIADLTGELMRKCINTVASGDLEEPFHLCLLMQNIYDAFLVGGNYSRDLQRKTQVLKTSLEKVENACYAIKVRGSETPKHVIPYFFSGRQDGFNEMSECEL